MFFDLVLYLTLYEENNVSLKKQIIMHLIKKPITHFPSFFDELFSTDFRLKSPNRLPEVPSVNVKELDNGFELSLVAPGMTRDDFQLELEDGVLTISSEIEEEDAQNNDRFTLREYKYGSFSRSFTLPDSVNLDKIDAHYKDGILLVSLPKRKEALKIPKKVISVKS